ncbi:unnamed protein product [Lota lota]
MNCSDIEYIWQSRIYSGFTYKRNPGPFPDAAAIGLDFNVACKRKTKLDLSLLTNGVVLDIYDFGKASVGSVKYLVSDILEYNFDTGMVNDKQRYVYTNRVFSKIGLLKKYAKQDEVFLLPDPNTFNLSGVSEVLSRPYTNLSEFFVKSTPMGCERIHEDNAVTESVHADQDGESEHVDEATKCSVVKGLYPHCQAIGLDLYIRPMDTPKQKLDAHFLTSKVIFEVLKFVKMVCGTQRQIISDVLNHNFDLSAYKSCIWEKIIKIRNGRNDLIQLDARQAFRKKPCTFVQNNSQKRGWKRRWVNDYDSQALASLTKHGKRKRKPKYDDVFCDFGHLPHDDRKFFSTSYEEMDAMQETQMGEKSDTSFDPGHDCYQRPAVPFSCSSEGGALPGRFSEDVSSGKEVAVEKLRLWKRRAMRSKQILTMWFKDKNTHLDFNVGSGAKLNTDLQLLTNGILEDIFKFACHMRRTQTKFTLEIFQNNFRLDPQDTVQCRFLVYIITKIKNLVSHRHKKSANLLNAVVGFPEAYSMVDIISSSTPAEAVTQPSATFLEPCMENYPFCMELGINLWAVKERALNEKLDLGLLTNGALLEVSSFIRKLCGNVWEVMYDVLEHNFHLNLQGGEIAQALQKWCGLQKTPSRGNWAFAELNMCFDKIVQANPNRTKEHTPDRNGIHVSKARPFNQAIKKRFADELKQGKSVHCDRYPLCKEMRINLEVNSKWEARAKLDLQVLTRAVMYEIHRYVVENPQEDNYVPALYNILEDNFDLSSQLHRRCQFALAIASQVKAMAGNFRGSFTRKGDYPNKVFELPFEFPISGQVVCKDEPEDGYCELEPDDDNDAIEFVCQFIPVDIEVKLD